MRALALTALLAASGALTGEGPATGRVWAQPSLEITFASTNAVQLRFAAKANTGYVIARRDSLSEGTWQPLVVLDPVTFDHAVYFTDTVSSSNSIRFYRVQGSGSYRAAKGLTERDSSLLSKLSEDEGLRDPSFTFEPDIRLTLPATSATNSLSAERAGVFAQELANKRARSLFKCEPFVRDSPASQVGGQWVWRARHGWGAVDFEAEVRFNLEGAEPHVNVVLLDNRL